MGNTRREPEGDAGLAPVEETREEGGGQDKPLPAGQLQARGESILGPSSCRNSPAPPPGSGLGNEVLDSRLRTGQWAARPRLQVHHQSRASERLQRLTDDQTFGATWLHRSHLGGWHFTGVR